MRTSLDRSLGQVRDRVGTLATMARCLGVPTPAWNSSAAVTAAVVRAKLARAGRWSTLENNGASWSTMGLGRRRASALGQVIAYSHNAYTAAVPRGRER